ncbi:hypothetical protein BVRB_4g079700 [Beta vulgaris subsp. vulgaris]|nr:hypothetical protein BVRB_4g079700 [Beta vulgaris subsp. vulgaris]
MGRTSFKVMLAYTILVIVGVTFLVEGARDLKDEPQKSANVVHPENLFEGLGGLFPTPGGTGFGPRTGTPGLGSPIDFCSIPSLGCVSVEPANPGSTGASGSGSSTPLPFP